MGGGRRRGVETEEWGKRRWIGKKERRRQGKYGGERSGFREGRVRGNGGQKEGGRERGYDGIMDESVNAVVDNRRSRNWK